MPIPNNTMTAPTEHLAKPNPDGKLWFAVYTNPRAEKAVLKNLIIKGVESFLPLTWRWYRKRGRREAYQAPLLPGYLFVRLHPINEMYIPVLRTPGVVYMLKEDPSSIRPLPVPDNEIDSLRIVIESKLRILTEPYINCGDMVEIVEGPLTGCHGKVVKRKHTCRLVVSVDLMQRSVSVEILERWLEKTSQQVH